MTVTIPGITIDAIGDGTISGGSLSGGSINRSSGRMVVSVSQTHSPSAVGLPSGMNVGDTVEIYTDMSLQISLAVFAPSEESFGVAGGSGVYPYMPINGGAIFRKIDTSLWGVVRNTSF